MTSNTKNAIEYSDWDDLRNEIAAEVGQEKIDTAKAELHAYLRAYNLAEARKRRHLTQAQVADAMGLTQGRVSQIEHGNVGESEVETLCATPTRSAGNCAWSWTSETNSSRSLDHKDLGSSWCWVSAVKNQDGGRESAAVT